MSLQPLIHRHAIGMTTEQPVPLRREFGQYVVAHRSEPELPGTGE
jgi:hypothetical protein